VINVVYAFFETFAIVDTAPTRPGKETAILVYKVYYDASRRSTSAAPRRSRW